MGEGDRSKGWERGTGARDGRGGQEQGMGEGDRSKGWERGTGARDGRGGQEQGVGEGNRSKRRENGIACIGCGCRVNSLASSAFLLKAHR